MLIRRMHLRDTITVDLATMRVDLNDTVPGEPGEEEWTEVVANQRGLAVDTFRRCLARGIDLRDYVDVPESIVSEATS